MDWERPISSEDQLRALIPEPLKQVRLKILDHLERHSQHLIAMSSLAALSCVGADGKTVVSLITSRGLVVPRGEKTLRIDDPDRSLNEAWGLGEGVQRSVGGLFV